LFEDACGKRIRVVLRQDRHGALQNDGAMVKVLIDEVDRATGNLRAVVQGLLLGVESGKRWQQRWMNIENALTKSSDEFRGKQAHVSRQADQVHLMLAQTSNHLSIVLGSFHSLGLDHMRVETALLGRENPRDIGLVGNYNRDLRILNASGGDGVGDGKKI